MLPPARDFNAAMDNSNLQGTSHANDDPFFASLFDVKFHKFVTPTIVKGTYILVMLISGLMALGILFSDRVVGNFVVRLVIAAFVFFLFLTITRLGLETAMVLHRIEHHLRDSARR